MTLFKELKVGDFFAMPDDAYDDDTDYNGDGRVPYVKVIDAGAMGNAYLAVMLIPWPRNNNGPYIFSGLENSEVEKLTPEQVAAWLVTGEEHVEGIKFTVSGAATAPPPPPVEASVVRPTSRCKGLR